MSNNLRIVAAQINTLVGDIYGNTQKVIINANRARDEFNASLIIFPELVLTGYPPEDLLLRPELYQRLKSAISLIKKSVKNIHIIIGYPELIAKKHYNTAAIIYNGKILATYHKNQLPNYGVFDEKRYFEPGTHNCIFKLCGQKIALSICEDMWFPDSMRQAKQAGAKLMLSINSSPFDFNKLDLREKILRQRVREGKMPVIYVNTIGGQDELVFDGSSMVLDAKGKITQRAPCFEEVLLPIDIAITKQLTPVAKPLPPKYAVAELVYKALVIGTRDYIEKNHFPGVVIGISGGIDSALVAAIAVDAIGPERVEGMYLPSHFSRQLSKDISYQLANNLQIKLSEISIEPIFQAYLKSLKKEFQGLPQDTTEENLQARCRGTILMAESNKKGLLVLSTGNKSENAVGYATLYGDMAGGFCVLKDVPKTLVYLLANYRNQLTKVIPAAAITRPPSAELATDQKDSDTLPPYPVLDAILERYVELDQDETTIVRAGFAIATVAKVIRMVKHSEYKRRQAPPGIRITPRAFGKDRRYPITSGY